MRQTVIALQDSEIGQRAYLLSGQASDLEPYERARLRIETGLRQLEAAAAGDPDTTRQVREFRCRRQREARADQRHHRRLPALWPRVRPRAGAHRVGQTTSDQIRQIAESFIEGQRLLLARRLAAAALRAGAVRHRRSAAAGRRLPVPVHRHVHRHPRRQAPRERAARALADRIAPPAVHPREPAGPDLRDRRRRQGRGVERGLPAPVGLGSRQARAR